MPQTPPPPQPPVNPQPPIIQERPVYIPVPTSQPNNEVDINNPNESRSNSVSNAENVSTTAASLNAYQVNSNHESTYYRYQNGVSMPGTSIYGDLSVINDSWNWNRTNVVASVGIRHTFGGTQKKLAVESVARDNLGKSLSICDALGVFNGKVSVNYEMMPHLQDCQYITQNVVVEKTPVNEIKILKQEIQEYRQLLKKQQQDIFYYQQKIEREYELGTNVQVGG